MRQLYRSIVNRISIEVNKKKVDKEFKEKTHAKVLDTLASTSPKKLLELAIDTRIDNRLKPKAKAKNLANGLPSNLDYAMLYHEGVTDDNLNLAQSNMLAPNPQGDASKVIDTWSPRPWSTAT